MSYHTRELGKDAAMTPDTVMWIASMTKAITAAAAMQLVERGQLHLDTAAADVVPELARAQVLEGFDASGPPQLRPPRRAITLKHLLTHTAGFSYEIWRADIARYQAATNTPGITTCENTALMTPLLFDPGERWDYGINIDWVGKMVEAASGQRLGDDLQQHLLAPLGMHSTSFKLSSSQRDRLASMHARGPDGGVHRSCRLKCRRSRSLSGRWWFVRYGARLSALYPDALAWWYVQWSSRCCRPRPCVRWPQNHIGDLTASSCGRSPRRSPRRQLFPWHATEMGLEFLDQHCANTARSLAWEHGVGGTRQHLLLDRSDAARDRRVHDAAPAVL